MASGTGDIYKFKLQTFEGPLDLLLHLVRINEVDIADIPIVEITDQFLQYLDLMKEIDIDIGSEFMLMAATLIYIKTKMLLPYHEEAEELREELVKRLLEYEQYRAAAAALSRREEQEIRQWRRPDSVMQPFLRDKEVLVEADLFDLITAFQRVLTSIGADAAVEVEHRKFAVEDKMEEIEQALKRTEKIFFSEFAARYKVKRELIAFFLAILELMRRRRLRVLQRASFGEIILAGSLIRGKKKRTTGKQQK